VPGVFDIKWSRSACRAPGGEGGLSGGGAGAAGDLGHVLGHAAADGCLYTYKLVTGHAQGARKAHGEVVGGATASGEGLSLQKLGAVSCAQSVGSLALSLDWSSDAAACLASAQVSPVQVMHTLLLTSSIDTHLLTSSSRALQFRHALDQGDGFFEACAVTAYLGGYFQHVETLHWEPLAPRPKAHLLNANGLTFILISVLQIAVSMSDGSVCLVHQRPDGDLHIHRTYSS
jgi:hypothetical protein